MVNRKEFSIPSSDSCAPVAFARSCSDMEPVVGIASRTLSFMKVRIATDSAIYEKTVINGESMH